jgi:hypothetical protein
VTVPDYPEDAVFQWVSAFIEHLLTVGSPVSKSDSWLQLVGVALEFQNQKNKDWQIPDTLGTTQDFGNSTMRCLQGQMHNM